MPICLFPLLVPIRNRVICIWFAAVGQVVAEKGCAADQVVSGDEPPDSVVHWIGLV